MCVSLPQQLTHNTVTKYHRPTAHKNENHSTLYQQCITSSSWFSHIQKNSINEHNKHPNGGPLVSPPSTHYDPYKHMTIGHSVTPTCKSAIKLQHHTNSNYNSATTTIIDLGHPTVKHHFFQRYILLLKASKGCITGLQSMDHTCNMIQMIETVKGIFWSVKRHGDVSIAIGAFADIDRLPDFDDMMAHPALLVPHKIPVEEDVILPYFPNLTKAIPGEFSVTPFVMAHTIPFQEIQAWVVLNIWPHSIIILPDQSDPYDIPKNMFYNSQILSQNCPSEPTQ
jgi:hypothetical protein